MIWIDPVILQKSQITRMNVRWNRNNYNFIVEQMQKDKVYNCELYFFNIISN